ncbi:hypothetical protein F4811DRAFT_554947 [Daldinia bambusicola]|nr:hypothetical protein F4811DRAFT_554947 [Daldinia bambusicola]
MSSQPGNTSLSPTIEDRRIYGFGPNYRMPYSCPSCLGTPRLVKDCQGCNGTGLVWDNGSEDICQGKDKRQTANGESSPGSSSLPSYSERG